MKENAVESQNYIYNKFLNKSSTAFLRNMTDKIKVVKKNIKNVEKSRDKIIKKIADKDIVSNSRRNKKHIYDSETALECVNIISKNLYKLSDEYNTINQLNSFIVKKHEDDFTDYHLKIYIGKLKTEIKNTEELETKIEEENEKNYLIINNFLDDEEEYSKNKYIYTNIDKITLENLKDNLILKIGEKTVELPYTKKEIEEFMIEYPDDYKTPQDVIEREFIASVSMFKRYPILARFKETYYLCRTKEMMTIFDSFIYAKSLMFRSDINAYIIAATKSKQQLEKYIDCLENNRLDEFKCFKIVYEINPTVVT